MAYAPIHNHTQWSALDGLATPKEIAQRCQEIGCPCCGITDHGTVSGHLEFAKVMAEHDIKPVFGCELYHGWKSEFRDLKKQERDQAHFVAGAMTDEGLRNLWSLVSDASTNYRFVGRVNFDMMEARKEGMFATTACISGVVAQGILEKGDWDPYEVLNRLLGVYGDNLYIELHTYPGEEHELLNVELVRIGQERGVPFIYATDAHFASPGQYELHDTYVAAQTGDDIYMDPGDRKMWHPKSLYIQDEAEIREHLSYLPENVIDEALANSSILAEKCNASIPGIRKHMPAFIPAECEWMKNTPLAEMSAKDAFVNLVSDGIERRYSGETTDREIEAWDRAGDELEVFLDAGLEHYFLQAWDFCEFCNREGIIRGPGRGSAAGAITSYALGITDVDPLHYGLIFERFYNPGRAEGFPDIDNDFPVQARKRVRQYLMDRWGHDKVRAIGTTTRLKPKSALDKMRGPCGVTYSETDAIKKIVNKTPDIDILGADSIGWMEWIEPGKTIYVWDHVGDEIVKWMDQQPPDRIDVLVNYLNVVANVCSRVSGYGVHPSGTVVSDVPLEDELPCMWNRGQEVQVTCFPMSDVDNRQFLKQDLLGLRNLDTLMEWERRMADELGSDFAWSGMDKQEWPEEMWELLDRGLTLGIFQIEDGYARRLCKEFKPRSVEDLGIIGALNRPGPIRSGAPDSFIARRNGTEDVSYDHPILVPILEPTYGWFLYQEQVIAFFNALGYNLSESDAVRKILGKKKPEAMRALYLGEGEWEGRGYKAMTARMDIDEEAAQVIWSKLEDFAKYSFNKSHAIAYAAIGFRTLYAKWRSVPKFDISCIITNPDDSGKYVGEGRRMNLDVRPPDIRHSEADIEVIDGNIYFGFSNIKGIGKGCGQYICKLVDENEINTPDDLRRVLEERQLEWEGERNEALKRGQSFKKRSPRQTLQANKIDLLEQAGAFDSYIERSLTLPQRQKIEKELLQVILSDDSEAAFAANGDMIENCHTYLELEEAEDNARLKLPGVVATIVPKKTKKDGKAMGIVTIEYEGDEAEFVVFPREWASYKFLWKERTPAVFTLVNGDRGLRFDKGQKLTL